MTAAPVVAVLVGWGATVSTADHGVLLRAGTGGARWGRRGGARCYSRVLLGCCCGTGGPTTPLMRPARAGGAGVRGGGCVHS